MAKPLNFRDPEAPMSLEAATTYLKKMNEWESVVSLDRDTIIKWAEFLKNRESTEHKAPARKIVKKA